MEIKKIKKQYKIKSTISKLERKTETDREISRKFSKILASYFHNLNVPYTIIGKLDN